MSRRARRVILLLAVLPLVPFAAADDGSLPSLVTRPRIALIIDDLGYGVDNGRRAVELPGPVACAVLPATPRGRMIADMAAARGKEVLLHLPLQAEGLRGDADPGALRLDMSRRQFAAAFAANLASVPHAIGVNNHRGSMLTRHPGHMQWLMQELRARESLFFVDSFTTHRSVALQLAAEAGVPAARRDVFLDDTRTPASIDAQFQRLKERARRDGSAIGIGHPHAVTLAYLEQALPLLAAEGFDLVPVRSLLQEHADSAEAIEPGPATDI